MQWFCCNISLTVVQVWPGTVRPASRKGRSEYRIMSENSPDRKRGVPTFILFGIRVVSNQPCLSAEEGATFRTKKPKNSALQ